MRGDIVAPQIALMRAFLFEKRGRSSKACCFLRIVVPNHTAALLVVETSRYSGLTQEEDC